MSQIPAPTGSLWAAIDATPHNGTSTSREAANLAKNGAGAQATAVLACIREAGASGRTMNEVEDLTGIMRASICARIAALREARLITATEHTRRTPSGRRAVVWVAVGHVTPQTHAPAQ